MSEDIKLAQERTDEQLLAGLRGELCLHCGARKSMGRPFCLTDYLALTLPARWRLSEAKSDEAAVQALRSALHDLRALGGERRTRYIETQTGTVRWRHHNEQDLENAGYTFSGHARCGVPGCNARIVWYVTPNRKRMAVNLADCQPHFATCADPQYFAMRREEKRVQSSARRAQRRAQRG